MPFFARWERDDRFLQIRLASGFVHTIANETVRAYPKTLFP